MSESKTISAPRASRDKLAVRVLTAAWIFAFALILPGCRQPAARSPQSSELPVGSMAPEIEGVDLDGVPFKLSDYRGKVVLLTFSGEWCPACKALYPFEKSLVERFADKPFAMLSVATVGDPSQTREELKAIFEKKQLPWRAWFAGPPSTSIAARYGVQYWPSLFVIDGRGVIRYVFDGNPHELAEAIHTTLLETGS